MGMTPAYDAVVCGAGAAGLTLARALGRQGMRVLVVDKQPHQARVFKGELLQPRSLEICDALGVLQPLGARGALTTTRLACRNADGSEIGALDYRLLSGRFNYCLVHDYHDITAAMADGMDAGVEVRRGTRVDGLLTDRSGRVSGVRLTVRHRRYDVRTTFVAGCDGPASSVRKYAGIEVRADSYAHELLAMDLEGVGCIGSDIAAHLTRDGLRLLYAIPHDRARLYVQLKTGELRAIGRSGRAAWAERLLASMPALEPVAVQLRAALPTCRAFTARQFNAPRWTAPGLALVGDAAHSVHPMAGQGMNAAIADGYELAARIAASGSLDDALAEYEATRRRRMEDIARLSNKLATLFTDSSWPVSTLGRRILRKNQANLRMQYVLTYNMSGLGMQRFTWHDRLIQLGLVPDRRARQLPPPVGPSQPRHRG